MPATLENRAHTQRISESDWRPEKAYRIHLLLTQDEEDVFSAIALNLPGAGSCGMTEREAIDNAKDAVRSLLEAYKAAGETIPWKDTSFEEIPAGAKQKWVIVDG